ncbi:hypothetical protein BYT27DRAFT_7159669 [Phlegmacium glaucopus]|nr:hypothetical protein BYT27DRAFT_7159669 [Phlegmacium glaucopus]
MTTISKISDVLGDYMLKGWVLTDQSCPTPGCAVPLMRSPKGRTPVTVFCASCSMNSQETHTQPQNIELACSSNPSSESYISRSSTPPTEISESLSSPIFAPPPETVETRRRREQSDRASSEIGKKLLKGWAMLADECPNESCYGVPLVRPPKSSNDKDPRKNCVICGNMYTTETDSTGRETLTLFNVPLISSNLAQSQRYDSFERFQASTQPSTVQQSSVNQHPQVGQLTQLSTPPTQLSTPPTIGVDESSQALQKSLQALSRRLTALSSISAPNCISIGETADTISKVTAALAQVRQLQWSESQAKSWV